MTHFLSPNLAPNAQPILTDLPYPLLVSEKFDGVRCLIIDGVAYSRKGLELHDKFQERFSPIFNHLEKSEMVWDCEVYHPAATFQQIVSSIANDNDHERGLPLRLYVFDVLSNKEWERKSYTPFQARYQLYQHLIGQIDPRQEWLMPVEQKLCQTQQEVKEYFDLICSFGGEGVMLRSMGGLYKHGRSTLREGSLYKYKPFADLDAIIIGFEPKARLTSEAKERITTKDALGRSKRGFRKGDREIVDEIGAIICQVPERTYVDDNGVVRDYVFKATWVKGTPLREEITWDNKEDYLGKWVEVNYCPVGEKHLPRFPRAKRLRPDLQ